MKNKLFLLLPALALVFGMSACDNGPMIKGTSGTSSNTSQNGNSSNASNNSSGANGSSSGNLSSEGGGSSEGDPVVTNTDYSFKVNDGVANVITTEGQEPIVSTETQEVLGTQYQFTLDVVAEQKLTFFNGSDPIYPGAGENPGNEHNNVSYNLETHEISVVVDKAQATLYFKVYSDGYSIWLTGNEEGTGGGNFDPNAGGGGGGDTTSYGLIVNGTDVTPAVPDGEDPYTHKEQYKVLGFEAGVGDVIKIRNVTAEEDFVANVDPASFNNHISTYIDIDENGYTVKKAFVADIYIKIAFEDNDIYFGLIGGGDPVDMSTYKTVYLFRPNEWNDWIEPHVYYWYSGTPSEDYTFNSSPKMVSVKQGYTHAAISKTGEVYAYALPKAAKGLVFFRWDGDNHPQVEKEFTTTWGDETNNAFYLDYDGSDKMVATTFAESNLVFGLVGGSPLSWDSDQAISISNGVGSYELVVTSANTPFKIRRDAAWDVAYGYSNLDSDSIALCSQGDNNNAVIKATGTYTISFNVAKELISLTKTA